MKDSALVLIGAGGHAKSCIDVVEQQRAFQIVGLVGLKTELFSTQLGYKVIASDDSLNEVLNLSKHVIVAIGQITTAARRRNLYLDAKKLGFELPVIISPGAFVSPHAEIDAGTVVMHGAIINAGAKIGKNCIINTHATIEHDCTVGDHCHISTGAVLNGGVRIAQGSFIGSGAIIKNGVSIGENCLIGMGLAVRNDLFDGSVYKGS